MREVIADKDIALGIYRRRARPHERSLQRGAIHIVFDTIARDGRHGARGHIQLANLRVVPVGDDEVALIVARDAGGEKERRLQRGAVFQTAAARDGCHVAVRRDLANAAVEEVGDDQIALQVEGCLRRSTCKTECGGGALSVHKVVVTASQR